MNQYARRRARGLSRWRWGAWLSLILLLSGCGAHTPAAVVPVPWADQLRTAEATAQQQHPTAALSGVELVTDFRERPTDLATSPVRMTFNISTTNEIYLRYESADPAHTIIVNGGQTGRALPALPPAARAAIQQSPVDVIQTTWENGRRYLDQFAADPVTTLVRVQLISDRTLLPAQVQSAAAWMVRYTVDTTPLRHSITFWVDSTSGAVLAHENHHTP